MESDTSFLGTPILQPQDVLLNRSAHSAGPNRGVGPWAVLWLCGIPSGVPWRSSGVPWRVSKPGRTRTGNPGRSGTGNPRGPWASSGGPWSSLGGSLGGVGGPLAVPGLHWGVPGGRWGSPGGPRGSSGKAREAPKTQKVFSECLGGSGGSPGVILVVGGGPVDRPGRWKC